MAKNYKWKTDAIIISGGYPGEETGIIGGSTDWHTTDALTGTSSAQYFYRDSASSTNSNSSRVVVDVLDSWTASISASNYLTVTLSTTISGIWRDDIRGNPGAGGSNLRDIYIRREDGGAILWQVTGDNINTAHSILSAPLTLGSWSFTLAPGENLSQGSVYFRNNVAGHGGDPTPSIYVDTMWLGVSFQNILPKDYRPGATLNANTNVWRSHNRLNGACHVLANVDNMTWQEMRTLGAPTALGNPPSIYHDNKWYNQMKIGKE